jgi:DNA-binding GntR family transcriptional regulator
MRWKPAQTRAVCALLESAAATAAAERRAPLEALDADFHRSPVALAGNRTLLETWEALRPCPDTTRLDAHHEIANAVAAGDAAEAAAAVLRHLSSRPSETIAA